MSEERRIKALSPPSCLVCGVKARKNFSGRHNVNSVNCLSLRSCYSLLIRKPDNLLICNACYSRWVRWKHNSPSSAPFPAKDIRALRLHGMARFLRASGHDKPAAGSSQRILKRASLSPKVTGNIASVTNHTDSSSTSPLIG